MPDNSLTALAATIDNHSDQHGPFAAIQDQAQISGQSVQHGFEPHLHTDKVGA